MSLPTKDPDSPALDAKGGVATATAARPGPRATAEPFRFDRRTWLALLVVWAISLIYAATVLRWGWIPRDEGLLAHSAERVLSGQVPHRDFQDVYVGLLSYIHAFAFRLWGTNLASLRFMVFAWFALFVPVVYWIASRMVNRMAAALTTLIAVAWSLPNYPASMPSWYNLFFATFGVAAIFFYVEVNSPWLLFLAGMCAGFSCLFKITGLYFVAAVFLFFLWRNEKSKETAQRTASRGGRALAVVVVVIFLGVAVLLLRSRLGAGEIYHFLLPQLAIAAAVLWQYWRSRTPGPSQSQGDGLARMVVPFGLGVMLPVAAFAAFYARIGALRQLVIGAFVLPTRRLALVGRSPAGLISLVPMILVLSLIMASASANAGRRRFINAVLLVGFAASLILSGRSVGAFTFSWYAFATLIPAVVVLAVPALYQRSGDPLQDDRLMLLVTTVGVSSLMQYPFSNAAYFCYVAPLLVLTTAGLLKRKPLTVSTLSIICGFALLFPVLRLRPLMERDRFSPIALARLELPRGGGLYVRSDQAREYEQLVHAIHEHAAPGSYIYAAPDDPQIYFLSGMRNPTSIMYSLFDEPRGQTERVLQAIAGHDVRVVVIDTELGWYSWVPSGLLPELNSKFPQFVSIGKFEVRWRQ
jgi:hypothetical protein